MLYYLGRILSIQSHTVHGHVGNKSAVFPLQLLGFNVDPINSVQFSNHTGYANGFKGDILSGEQLDALMEGLEANGMLSSYTALLTGKLHVKLTSATRRNNGRIRTFVP